MRVEVDGLAWLPLDRLSTDQAKRLEAELTITPRSYAEQEEEPQPVRLFQYRGDPPTHIGVPREYFFGNRRLDHEIVWKVSDGEPASFRSREGEMVSVDGGKPILFKLKPEQDQISGEIASYLRNGGTGAIVQAAVGWGKSTALIEIARRLGRKTLILTHKEPLLVQWKRRVEQFFKGTTVGRIQQDVCDVEGHDIVVGMVQSIALREYPPEVYSMFGTILIDEVHRMGAPLFSRACPKFKARWRIGCTATPRRKDGTEDVFFWHIGKIKAIAKQKTLIPDIRTVPTEFRIMRTPDFNPALAKSWLVLRFMVNNSERNALILREIMGAAKAGRKILVLGDRVLHLQELKDGFEEYCRQDKLRLTASLYVRGRQEKGVDERGKRFVKTFNQSQADLEKAAGANVLFGTWSIACIPLTQPLINYRKGTEYFIDQCAPNGEESVLTMKQGGVATEVLPAKYQATGLKKCVKVSTSNYSFMVSVDHKVLTQRGWVGAASITPKDYLVIPRKVQVNEIAPELTESESWMVGALLGDGCLSQAKKGLLGFVSADKCLVEKMGRVLHKYNMGIYETCKYHYKIIGHGRHGRGNKSPLRTLVEKYGMDVIAPQKKIPDHFLLWPESHIRAILIGLIDTDGGICTRRGELSFSSTSIQLARQFKYLLWRLGFYGVMRESRGRSRGDGRRYRTIHRVCMDAGQTLRLVGMLPDMLKRKAEKTKPIRKTASSDMIPAYFVKVIKAELKRRGILHTDVYQFLKMRGHGMWKFQSGDSLNAASVKLLLDGFNLDLPDVADALDYIWIPVKNVREVGEMEVADVMVPVTHNLLLGEFVVHNSEGLDIPELDCLVMVTPHSDVEQAIGRICRILEGKKHPIVSDIVDPYVPWALKLRLWREKHYAKIGAKFKPIENIIPDVMRRLN